jgi:hypothetical protein
VSFVAQCRVAGKNGCVFHRDRSIHIERECMVDEPERLRDKLKTISQLIRNPRCIIFNHFQEAKMSNATFKFILKF